MFNLLDSHDTERLIFRTGSLAKFYQQMAILFTMEGTTCIYYGTEIAMDGGFDPDCRRCMPWTDIEDGKYDDRIHNMKTLIDMRKKYHACKGNQIVWLPMEEQPRVLHYIKKVENGSDIEVIVNASKESIDLPKGKEILFSYGCQAGTIEADGVCILG